MEISFFRLLPYAGLLALGISLGVLVSFIGKSRASGEADLREYVTKQCGTEPAFRNAYWDEKRPGIYVDVNTGRPLFSSIDKFDSKTGWPSFTKTLDSAEIVEREDLSFGMNRTEVRTAESHLGHLFSGEGPNGTDRYCINSASLRFVPFEDLESEGYLEFERLFGFEKAVLAGGCFWGVEHLLKEIPGVVATKAGYSGGKYENPSYQDVSTGSTGHAEAVLVAFDPKVISYRDLLGYFWRLHDPTQVGGQGSDIGPQYRSQIFYFNDGQKEIALGSREEFNSKRVFGDKLATTEITPFEKFYPAEEYHQDYIEKNPLTFCHALRPE